MEGGTNKQEETKTEMQIGMPQDHMEASSLQQKLGEREESIRELEAKLKTAMLSNFTLREENKRLNKLLSRSGLQPDPNKI